MTTDAWLAGIDEITRDEDDSVILVLLDAKYIVTVDSYVHFRI